MSFYAALWSMLFTAALIAAVLHSGLSRHFADIPNERSLHHQPVPRLGGLAMMLALLTSSWWQNIPLMIWIPLLLLIAVSVVDDLYDLAPGLRLMAHLAAAVGLLYGTGLLQQDLMLALALLLAVVWMTNLYNFMDGSDGLAGGMTLFGFAGYALAAGGQGDTALAVFCLSISAAALAFLHFNFHPARIFMGDAGSIPLGFLTAAVGILGWQRGLWPLWFPLLLFSPFVLDASITLLKRAWRGEKLWRAHREHYYQRAIQLGLGHRRVALYEYGVMLLAALCALLALQAPEWQAILLGGWLLLCATLMVWVDLVWQQRQKH